MGRKVSLRYNCWAMSTNFVFKSLLTTPSNVSPFQLKLTFPPIISIFTEGDEIESRLSSWTFSTLLRVRNTAEVGECFQQGYNVTYPNQIVCKITLDCNSCVIKTCGFYCLPVVWNFCSWKDNVYILILQTLQLLESEGWIWLIGYFHTHCFFIDWPAKVHSS